MSYCRWSSDNFGCDLYVYEGVGGGYRIHVARNRIVGDVPKLKWHSNDDGDDARFWRLLASLDAQREFLATVQRTPIGLPHDGETFHEPDVRMAAARVLALRALGYRVPDDAVAALVAEAAEERDRERARGRHETDTTTEAPAT